MTQNCGGVCLDSPPLLRTSAKKHLVRRERRGGLFCGCIDCAAAGSLNGAWMPARLTG